ncbi:DNA mismatch repair protein MutL [Legionella norrlandica]|uniref:DNA mismatch repair protein MutL n=1 Tax=Legionella norrlandica TaxID=1498499 RepID=A0A0A2SU76_9GAMM|nr:DNA mismatch repair endonuclease MutL [Legionella norrlandica]KGP63276.1 DNA mismatch repair protein MutL [Legionella norrlandica]
MGMRIHQLSPAIANQIAAGEVIEKPASVVKELLENSLDAGASAITIEVSYGGLLQIKVSDNGAGIVGDDLPLAVAAHATSKIKTLNDLYSIESMGFRGEALASIASVAKVTIISKPEAQENAMMLRVVGDEMTLTPCARNVGTTVDVSDLFYNAPVRKRFLKSEKLEFQAIEMLVRRFALSAPTIALTLKHNKKLIFSLPPALNEQAKQIRMSKILGSSFLQEAIFLEATLGDMSLYGWLSSPNLQRSQNDKQWIYVNKRMVKDKLLQHALKQSYDGLLHPGRFPICLLYFTLPSAEVDVNVHPTKHEVRFQQPRLVHDFFTTQLTKALHSSLSGPMSHGSSEQGMGLVKPLDSMNNPQKIGNIEYGCPPYSTIMEASVVSEPYNLHHKNKMKGDGVQCHSFLIQEGIPLSPIKFNKGQVYGEHAKYYSEKEMPWVILNEQFILVFISHEPYLIDVVAIFQGWLKKRLINKILPLACRPLLVPISYFLPEQCKYRIDDLKGELAQIGIQIECSDVDRLLIRSIPLEAPYLNFKLFFSSLGGLDSLSTDKLIELICVSQSFQPKQLTIEERSEMNQWIIELFSTEKSRNIGKALTVDDCRMLLND